MTFMKKLSNPEKLFVALVLFAFAWLMIHSTVQGLERHKENQQVRPARLRLERHNWPIIDHNHEGHPVRRRLPVQGIPCEHQGRLIDD